MLRSTFYNNWIFVLAIVLNHAAIGYGQGRLPYHIQYSISDGLPSETVIKLYNDSRGLMWIGTDQGVCTFDGATFKTISNENATNTTILQIDEDEQGVIWILNKKRELFNCHNGKLVLRHDFSYLDTTFYFASWFRPTELEVVSKDVMHIGTRTSTISMIDGRFVEISTDPQTNLIGKLTAIGNELFTLEDTRLGCNVELLVQLPDTQYSFPMTWKDKGVPGKGELFTKRMNDVVVIAAQERVQYYDSFGKYHDLYLDGIATNSIVFIDEESFIVGTENKGFYLIENGEIIAQFLDGYNVITLARDFEGGIWAGTVGEGLIYIPNLNIYHSEEQTENIDIVTVAGYGQNLYTIDESYQIRKNGQYLAEFENEGTSINEYYGEIYHDSTESIISYKLFNDNSYHVTCNWKDGTTSQRPFERAARSLVVLSESDSMLSYHGGITIRAPRINKFLKLKVLNANGMIEENKEEQLYWIASSEGLALVKYDASLKDIQFIRTYRPDISFDRLFYFEDELFASADGRGIYWLNRSIDTLTLLSGTIEGFSMHHQIQIDQTCIIGTNHGLVELKKSDPPSYFTTGDLSDELGLSYHLVHDLVVVRDTLFLASDEGLICIPSNMVLSASESRLKPSIVGVSVNNAAVQTDSLLTIYTSDNLKFDIQVAGFKRRRNRTYEYRIMPLDSNWRKSTNSELTFFNLSDNSYTLEVRTSPSAVASASFIVQNYFYEEVWFIILIILLLVVLLATPFVYQRRLEFERIRFEYQQNNLRLQSLTSQLKPHFVFNALSSIQAFILKSSSRESSEYLSKFALHIRNALDQSRESVTTLSRAIESTKNYLDLEQLRLRNGFTYEINVDPQLSTEEIEVPVMLIQPYVENAVIHGISQLERAGIIEVHIAKIDERHLSFSVYDNGDGLENNTTHSRSGLGTTINDERIKILSALEQRRISIDFEHQSRLGGVGVTIVYEYDQ